MCRVVATSVLCVDWSICFFFQAEDGIRDLVRSRGLGDVYKRQLQAWAQRTESVYGYPMQRVEAAEIGRWIASPRYHSGIFDPRSGHLHPLKYTCLLYTSDAADERSSVDLGGRRIIKKKKL